MIRARPRHPCSIDAFFLAVRKLGRSERRYRATSGYNGQSRGGGFRDNESRAMPYFSYLLFFFWPLWLIIPAPERSQSLREC